MSKKKGKTMSKQPPVNFLKKFSKFIQIDETLLSTMARIPFAVHNSSPRLAMKEGQDPQILKIRYPDRRITQTGYDVQIGQYSFKKILKANSKIIAIIPRYKSNIISDRNNVVEITVLYINLETKKLEHIDLTTIHKIHSYFGFEYEWDMDAVESMTPGAVVREDIELSKSGNVADDNYYKNGVLLNVLKISSNQAAEDAMRFRKSKLKRFEFDMFFKAKVSYSAGEVLANLYGDENHYKPIPELGDKIHKSGALAVIKKFDPLTAPALLSNKNLMEFDPRFDKAIYLAKGSEGVVVDLKVYYSPNAKNAVFNSDILLKYNDALREYYKDLFSAYQKEAHNFQRRFSTTLEVGDATQRLLIDAQAFINLTHPADVNIPGGIKGMYRKSELNTITAEFLIKYTVTPTYGFKFADSYASKSVIADVVDDEFMPDGVDVIIEAKTQISRMNAGGMYEPYFADASRNVKDKVVALFRDNPELDEHESISTLITAVLKEYSEVGIGNHTHDKLEYRELLKILQRLPKHSIEYAFDLLCMFVKMFHPDHYTFYMDSTYEDKIDIIYQVITEEAYIFFPNSTYVEKPTYIPVMEVEASEFKPEKKHVTFINKDGSRTDTKDKVRVAPVYISILCKLPDEMNSCATCNFNHFGLPVQPSADLKTAFPSESRPTKPIGETESRGYASYPEDATKLLGTLINRGNNMSNHTNIYAQILRADKPSDIERLEESFIGNTIMETNNIALATAGVGFKYIEDNYYDYDLSEGFNYEQ